MQLAYMKCKNKELAEDLVQETCLKAYRSYLTKNQEAKEELKNPKAWLFKILVNTHIDYARKKQLDLIDINGLELADKKDTISQIESNFFFENLNNILNELEPEYRVIIYLADVDKYSYKEIAELLKVPMGTVTSRLYRARHALRELLTEKGYSREVVKAGK